MTKYVCEQISTENPQMCLAWVEQVTVLDQLAITPEQAQQLCTQITILFVIAFIFAKLRSAI